MSEDFRGSVRIERREHTRASDQRRLLQHGDVVRWAACGCTDELHDAPDHMDYVAEIDFAVQDGMAMGIRHWHVIRVEKSRVDT